MTSHKLFSYQEPGELEIRKFDPIAAGTLCLVLGNNMEILRFEPNGDIYVKGRLVENDKEVVEGMREFLSGARKC